MVALAAATLATLLTVAPMVQVPARADGGDSPRTFRPKGRSPVIADPATSPVLATPEDIVVPEGPGSGSTVQLHATVYTRNVARLGWRYPLILMMSDGFDNAGAAKVGGLEGAPALDMYYSVPKECSDRRDASGAEVHCMVGDFTQWGYAVAYVSVRGTGKSTGVYDYWGQNDARDFRAVVRHYAADPRFGKVGVIGGSGEAMYATAGAAFDDGAALPLATMVLNDGLTDFYALYAQDGAVFDSGFGQPGFYTGTTSPPGSDINERNADGSMATSPSVDAANYPSRLGGSLTGYPARQAPFLDPTGAWNTFWNDRSWVGGGANVGAPILYVQGLADATVVPRNLIGWWDAIPSFKRLVLPQMRHGLPWVEVPDYPWWETYHAWFDQFLLGLDAGVRGWPAVQVQMPADGAVAGTTWRTASSLARLGTDAELPLGSSGDEVTFGETVDGSRTIAIPNSEASTSAPVRLTGHPTLALAVDRISAAPANISVELRHRSADGSKVLAWAFCRFDPTRDGAAPDHCRTDADGRVVLSMPYVEQFLDRGALELVVAGLPDMTEPGLVGLVGTTIHMLPAGSGYTATIDLGRSSLHFQRADQVSPLLICSGAAGTTC
jgi:hypothetical protein